MNIAVIAPTEIPSRRANTMQVMKMTQALVALGHNVRLVVPGKSLIEERKVGFEDKKNFQPMQEAIWKELSYHYGLKHQFPIDWLPANPSLRGYDYSLRAVLWARYWKAQVLYTRLLQSAAIASTMGLATILETHDLPQGYLGPWVFLRFIKGKGASRLVVITHALATDLSQKFGIPFSPPFTIVAPDGVDLERYSHLPEPIEARTTLTREKNILLKNRLQAKRFTVGYTGHLYKGRGSEMFLELAARLPEVSFLIVGGEPQDVSDLQSLADVRKLDNIILTGFVANSELPHYQAACDVLIMPYQHRVSASSGGDISRYLSPMKLFEYLACERAIVSSNLPVLQEVLNSQNAILLPSDDIESWVNALLKLQREPHLRRKLAMQARQDASHFTWERRAEQMLEGLEN